MQALEIQGIKMQALLIAMHLFFDFSMLYVSKTIVIILLPYRAKLCRKVDLASQIWVSLL